MDEATIERDWRALVENGVVAAIFADPGAAEAWRAGLRARARSLGRRIRTGRSDSPSWWAVLSDWEDVVPRAVQLAKLREGFAWLALRDVGQDFIES